MKKTQMYFPINPNTKDKVEATAHQLNIPASNIISEIITQAFNQPTLNFKVDIPSTHISTNKEIERDDKAFAKGHRGKKHHLID